MCTLKILIKINTLQLSQYMQYNLITQCIVTFLSECKHQPLVSQVINKNQIAVPKHHMYLSEL